MSYIQRTVQDLQLDLRGMRVATEAASGYYMSTSLLGAVAGADEVVAVGADSDFGRFADIQDTLLAAATDQCVRRRIVCTQDRHHPSLRGVDVVTNSGFLRPLDADLLDHVGANAVITYMCEAWEFRPGDVDLDYCRRRRIPVYFSDEDGWGMGVFSMCGALAAKLCFEADLSVVGDAIAILSSDRFGPVIQRALSACGADAVLLVGPSYDGLDKRVWDGVVVAEYCEDREVIGNQVALEDLDRMLAPGATIVQFAGANDVRATTERGWEVFPPMRLHPHRMARTLAYLGARAVVRLAGIGLKVGWAACTGTRLHLSGRDLDEFVLSHSPAQVLDLDIGSRAGR
jgi:hypothetical protein